MRDLNDELWKLGILAKTEHNEVAPAQHELAPTSPTPTPHRSQPAHYGDDEKGGAQHGLCCLMHEKPFAGVNGSGKHNNWSLSTNTGVNLLEPGDSPPGKRPVFAVPDRRHQGRDDYQDLLRVSVASAGNDHRLGANEAPPAIISIFLGRRTHGPFWTASRAEAATPKRPRRK